MWKRHNWAIGHWAAAWENPGSTTGTLTLCHPLHWWSSANQIPAKSRAGGASQQGGRRTVEQTDICHRAGLHFTALTLTWALQWAHIHQGPASCKAQGTQHHNHLPETALPPQTLPGLLQLGCALGSALVDAGENIYSSQGSPICVLLSFP